MITVEISKGNNKYYHIRDNYYCNTSLRNEFCIDNGIMYTDDGEAAIPKLFGKNVQKYRKKAGLTQEQLSIKLQISQKHMSIIETGTQFASAPLIGKIAEVLEVSPAMLFGGYEHEVNYEQANATALLLEQFIQTQMQVLYSRLDKIEAKLNLLASSAEIN